jgi:hypothetical protein
VIAGYLDEYEVTLYLKIMAFAKIVASQPLFAGQFVFSTGILLQKLDGFAIKACYHSRED